MIFLGHIRALHHCRLTLLNQEVYTDRLVQIPLFGCIWTHNSKYYCWTRWEWIWCSSRLVSPPPPPPPPKQGDPGVPVHHAAGRRGGQRGRRPQPVLLFGLAGGPRRRVPALLQHAGRATPGRTQAAPRRPPRLQLRRAAEAGHGAVVPRAGGDRQVSSLLHTLLYSRLAPGARHFVSCFRCVGCFYSMSVALTDYWNAFCGGQSLHKALQIQNNAK